MADKTPQDIARRVGVSTDGKTVRQVIGIAREAFARRAQDYVDLHFEAAEVAAKKGDAGPAQWALERIAEAGQHVVDTAKQAPQQPTLQIGIAIGGVPQPGRALPAASIDAELIP